MSMPMRSECCVAPVQEEAPSLRPRKNSPRGRRALVRGVVSIALITVCGVAAAGVWSGMHGAADSLNQVKAAPAAGLVRVGSAASERRLGYVIVTGTISNCGKRPLTHVEVVTELLDKQNQTLRMESGLVAFDPLMPGDSAPYRIVLPDDSRATAHRERVRQFFGSRLD